jgi:hypothetical protein
MLVFKMVNDYFREEEDEEYEDCDCEDCEDCEEEE